MIYRVHETPTNEGTSCWTVGNPSRQWADEEVKIPVRISRCRIAGSAGWADGVTVRFEDGGEVQYPATAVAVYDDGKDEDTPIPI